MNKPSRRIIQNLREFNRKEQFYVIGMCLSNPDFSLGSAFREKLGKRLRLNVPEDAFAAMDYHLDWIYASLLLSNGPDASGIHLKGDEITVTSEDTDFLVAFEDEGIFHILMIEAKGDSAFSNSQLRSKANRLCGIFGKHGGKWNGVIPHFALMSPYRPTKRLNCDEWPKWMHPGGEVEWMELQMPESLKKVTRCEKDGKPSIKGKYWKTEGITTWGFQRG